MNNYKNYYIIVLNFVIISYKDMCFLFGEDDNGKCGCYWDNYIYIYIDYMGYMTNPIDLCWFMKLITHLAINWGCFFFGEMCM